MTAVALGVLIVVSTAVALLPVRQTTTKQYAGRLGHPATWLVAVVALVFVDQVCVSVYVLRVHHGDPTFITRYFEPGWFHIDRAPWLVALADHVPAPWLLAPSVLRGQAFLELPFGILCYLLVARWFGVEAAARRLIWPASLSYTTAFCLIEWHIPNPHTVADIVIRVLSALLLPLVVTRLRAPSDPQPRDPVGLLAAVVSLGSLGWLVLALYETVFLYNLGDVRAHLPGMAIATALLAGARLAAAHAPAASPGPSITAVARTFGAFLTLFFVPALAIRYGIGFGAAYVAAAAAVTLAAVAVVRTLGPALKSPVLWLAGVAAAAAGAATTALTSGYAEKQILWASAAALVAVIAVATLGDAASTAGDKQPASKTASKGADT